jgi:hypothetical protein
VRLFLGVPSAGAPAQPFLDSLSRIELPTGTQAFERGIVTGNFVPAQRDVLLLRALEWKADVVAMCDDDMVLPAETLAMLCSALANDSSAAAVGALYYSRDGLRPMAVDGWDPDDTRLGWVPAFDRTPVAVDGVGFGCVVIRISAITPMERPYFSAQVFVERSAGRVRVCNEDYLFCARLRRAGHSVLLHPGVRCGHYDRVKNSVFPQVWETAAVTNRKRVLVQRGESYELVPLEAAPHHTLSEERRSADVVYVETP